MSDDLFNASEYLLDANLERGRVDHPAIVTPTGWVTYGELHAEVRRVAAGLRAVGLHPEQRVVILLPDSPAWVATFLAALRMGATPVPLSTMLGGDDLAGIARDARAVAAVVGEPLLEQAAAMVAGAPELRTVLVADEAEPALDAGADVAVHRWADIEGDDDGIYPTWPDSPAFWLYTSGTTGRPKAAMHRHGSLKATAETYAREVLGITADDRCYSVSKLFFAYGLGNNLTFPFSVGATAVLDPGRPAPATVAALAATAQPTLFYSVPTFYAALAASDAPREAFSSVRLGVSAGEALSAELYRRVVDRFGFELLDGIGSTEALHIFISNRAGDVRPGTSGRPVEGYDARLVDDDGAEVPAGEPGTLEVRGPSFATGYWCRDELTRRTFKGEWLRTGDRYARRPDGCYAHLGRSDDMMKVGGLWLSPVEVEASLVECDGVTEAAVVSRRDGNGLEKPVAFVVVGHGASVDAAGLVSHCIEKLGPMKRPRAIVFLPDLPKTATGKVQRFVLRGQLAEGEYDDRIEEVAVPR